MRLTHYTILSLLIVGMLITPTVGATSRNSTRTVTTSAAGTGNTDQTATTVETTRETTIDSKAEPRFKRRGLRGNPQAPADEPTPTDNASSNSGSTSPNKLAGQWKNKWWGAGFGSMRITATSGDCGQFETHNGRLTECAVSVDGRVLTGNWKREDGKYGRFQFTLVQEGRTFEGKAWYDDDKLPAIWNGKLERIESE